MLGDGDQQEVEEVALFRRRIAAGHQEEEELGETLPAHQIADEVATANLDAIDLGMAERRFGRSGLSYQHAAAPLAMFAALRRRAVVMSRYPQGPAPGPGPGRGGVSRRPNSGGLPAASSIRGAGAISRPPAYLTSAAMRSSIGGWLAKSPAIPLARGQVDEHRPDLRRRRDLGMAGDLAQGPDHRVGIVGQLDGAGVGQIFAPPRHGETERQRQEAGEDEDGDGDQDENDGAPAALAAEPLDRLDERLRPLEV